MAKFTLHRLHSKNEKQSNQHKTVVKLFRKQSVLDILFCGENKNCLDKNVVYEVTNNSTNFRSNKRESCNHNKANFDRNMRKMIINLVLE